MLPGTAIPYIENFGDGVETISINFDTALNGGEIGLGNDDAHTVFDDVSVQALLT